MIRRGIILSTLLTFLYSLANTAKAQVYTIESFEGTKAKIKLTKTMRGRVLSVSFLKDTLHLYEYIGGNEVHILNNKFLLIIYEVRGGTGSAARNTLILAVIENKLTASMLIDSYYSWFTPDPENTQKIDEQSLYKLRFKIVGNTKSNYKLIVEIHDELKSKRRPEINYKHNKRDTLNFDPNQHIFYTTHEAISRYFICYDPILDKEVKQHIVGDIPRIQFARTDCYYLKGEWYQTGDSAHLYRLAYNSLDLRK